MYPREEAPSEDPLEALLALATAARARIRPFAFMTAYGFLGGLLAAAVLLPLGVVALSRGGEFLAVVAIAGGALSAVSITLALRVDRVLSDFDRRLRAIEGFARSDPRPPIPAGDTAAARAVAWLERTDERFRVLLAGARDRLLSNARPLGASAPAVAAYFLRRSMYLPRQYHLFVDVFDKRVGVEDLSGVKEHVERVAAATKVQPDRVLVVQTAPAEIPEEVERWLDASRVLNGRGRAGCSVQLLVEREDGRYEVAPVFAG